MARRCLTCGALCGATRCPACTRHKDRARQAARGDRYGPEHRAARTALRQAVDAGGISCYRCGVLIAPGAPFDADHIDDGWAASHPTCNRAAGGRTPRGTPNF